MNKVWVWDQIEDRAVRVCVEKDVEEYIRELAEELDEPVDTIRPHVVRAMYLKARYGPIEVDELF